MYEDVDKRKCKDVAKWVSRTTTLRVTTLSKDDQAIKGHLKCQRASCLTYRVKKTTQGIQLHVTVYLLKRGHEDLGRVKEGWGGGEGGRESKDINFPARALSLPLLMVMAYQTFCEAIPRKSVIQVTLTSLMHNTFPTYM